MPLLMTMGKIVERASQAADLDVEKDDAISPALWKSFVDLVFSDLWPEVSLGAAKRYFETSHSFTADGSSSYDEPADHFAIVRIVRVDASGYETELRELRQGEEASFKGTTGDAVAYALVDDQLYLYPAPSSGTYKWYYQQQPTDIAEYDDDDVIDLVVPAGKAFMIWGVAAMAQAHHKQDATFALSQQAAALPKVQFQAANRHSNETRTRGPVEDDDDVVYGADGWPIR